MLAAIGSIAFISDVAPGCGERQVRRIGKIGRDVVEHRRRGDGAGGVQHRPKGQHRENRARRDVAPPRVAVAPEPRKGRRGGDQRQERDNASLRATS